MSKTIRLSIPGMSCAGCVSAIEKGLDAIPGIEQANVNLADKTASITGTADTRLLIEAVASAGFDATEIADRSAELRQDALLQAESRSLWRRAIVSGLVGAAVHLLGMFGFLPGIEDGTVVWLGISLVTLLIMIFVG